MRKTVFGIAVALAIFLGGAAPVTAGPEIVAPDATVRVQYQMKPEGGKTWTTVSTSLRGAVTEAMMANQLAARHPRAQIRILSAAGDRNVTHQVRYQMRQGNGPWTTSTTTLNNALTESMAGNQLRARFPAATIRILSFVKRN